MYLTCLAMEFDFVIFILTQNSADHEYIKVKQFL